MMYICIYIKGGDEDTTTLWKFDCFFFFVIAGGGCCCCCCATPREKIENNAI